MNESDDRLQTLYEEMRRSKQYLQEGRGSMDHVEKITERQSIDQMARSGEHRMGRQFAMSRLLESTYFGRIDFESGCDGAIPYYIGRHAFQGDDPERPMVYDWRAPVSGMFYDCEPGPASYESPAGTMRGRISLKRQYKVGHGELELMFDTGMHIQDDILQEMLGRATDERMRDIVSTIQRHQNAVIRDEDAHTLVLQGAAGSGKTSIALHRIAYLLYRYRDEMDSSQVLIVSPNRVFAHYIANVLPELGEAMVKETTMEALAAHHLRFRIEFQTFGEQVSALIEGDDAGFAERVRYKATTGFVKKLEEYAALVRASNLQPAEVRISFATREVLVPVEVVAEGFARNPDQPFGTRITSVVRAVEDHLRRTLGRDLEPKQRTEVREQLSGMVRRTNVQSLYRDFFLWEAEPHMFRTGPGSRWEYADVFPLIYLGILLEGCEPHRAIRHVVVDEMQDYTPVQYQVLDRWFPCRKTILGDRYQAVNPHASSTAEVIRDILPRSEARSLNKTYRSTAEITRFSLAIQPNPGVESVARHGPPPRVVACGSLREELEAVKAEIRDFLASEHNTLGVVCRTQIQAENFASGLREFGDKVHLLDPESTEFLGGIVVASAYYAKGLEFDRVVAPFCSELNYRSTLDRHLLYVACTRAMHRLTLTHTGEASPLLPSGAV